MWCTGIYTYIHIQMCEFGCQGQSNKVDYSLKGKWVDSTDGQVIEQKE